MKYSGKVVGPGVAVRQQHSTQQASKFHLANDCSARDLRLHSQSTRRIKFSITLVSFFFSAKAAKCTFLEHFLHSLNVMKGRSESRFKLLCSSVLNQDKTSFATSPSAFVCCVLAVGGPVRSSVF